MCGKDLLKPFSPPMRCENVSTHNAAQMPYTHYASALRVTEFSNAIEIHCNEGCIDVSGRRYACTSTRKAAG